MVIRELLEINFMYGSTIPISAYIDFLFIHHNFTMMTHKRMYIKCLIDCFTKKEYSDLENLFLYFLISFNVVNRFYKNRSSL